MISFSLEEAQLYRLLAGFFGRARIVPNMSVLAVCGGELPPGIPVQEAARLPANLGVWAKENRCLFTIVDDDDTPKLVIDFEGLERSGIDAERVEYQRVARPLLSAAGVRFFTITGDEFAELLKPSGRLDLFTLFKSRFEELGYSFGPSSET